MAIQLAGSSSTGDRRRRRIVVHGENAQLDVPIPEGDAAEMASQLVASAAAGPWVPFHESRIWIYATLIGLFLVALTFAWAQPTTLHSSVRPVTDHLLTGSQPILITYTEFLFLALSAQLSHLIGWYRSRGKLDFGGRYRFWPWATALFGLAAFGVATNSHRALGNVLDDTDLLTWRSETIAWLLPVCLTALPIALFLDRDIRNSRTCLWTIRVSLVLWIAEAWLELFEPDLQPQPWFAATFLLVPLFASATMFVGLWLHARIVAYVCPDPPELDEQSAWSLLVAGCRLTAGLLMFWRRGPKEAEDDSKPKRRKKKTEATEEATAKRKKKVPAKKTTSRTRTRAKTAEEDDSSEDSASDETEMTEQSTSESDSTWDESENQSSSDQWDEPTEEPVKKTGGQYTQVHQAHNGSLSGPHHRRQAESWNDENDEKPAAAVPNSYNNSSDEEDDEDSGYESESGPAADQMKGLSKRQKRELKRQQREQERSRHR